MFRSRFCLSTFEYASFALTEGTERLQPRRLQQPRPDGHLEHLGNLFLLALPGGRRRLQAAQGNPAEVAQ